MGQKEKYIPAYRLRRSGPETVIFIHGLGASKNSFDTCFELESFKDYTLASLDLPGCGRSKLLDGFSYSVKDQADLVLKWIGDLDLDQIILAGHSMGGVISQYLSDALGPRVEAFFNLEGNLGKEDCFLSAEITSSTQEVFEGKGFQQFKRDLRENIQKNPSPGWINYYQNISRASPRALYLSSISLINESCHNNLKEKFLTLSTKKWYVFGEKSMNLSTKKFLGENNIPYFIIPKSDHFMMDDQPSIFYRMLLEALRS